jgi:hypothetical protein
MPWFAARSARESTKFRTSLFRCGMGPMCLECSQSKENVMADENQNTPKRPPDIVLPIGQPLPPGPRVEQWCHNSTRDSGVKIKWNRK